VAGAQSVSDNALSKTTSAHSPDSNESASIEPASVAGAQSVSDNALSKTTSAHSPDSNESASIEPASVAGAQSVSDNALSKTTSAHTPDSGGVLLSDTDLFRSSDESDIEPDDDNDGYIKFSSFSCRTAAANCLRRLDSVENLSESVNDDEKSSEVLGSVKKVMQSDVLEPNTGMVWLESNIAVTLEVSVGNESQSVPFVPVEADHTYALIRNSEESSHVTISGETGNNVTVNLSGEGTKAKKSAKKHGPYRRRPVTAAINESSEVESVVTVARSHNTKDNRVWDKKHHCKYCEDLPAYPKLYRHLTDIHSDELEVARALSYPVGSVKRKLMWKKLANDGDYKHNFTVLRDGKGELVAYRRPAASKGSVDPSDLIPCDLCFTFVKKTNLWKHRKACLTSKLDSSEISCKDNTRMRGRSTLLLPISDRASKGLKDVILASMTNDEISDIVRTDGLIAEFGSRLYMKNGHLAHRHQYISQRLRELGRLVLGIKDLVGKSSIKLQDYITPKQFQCVVDSIRHICGFDEKTHSFKIPSLSLKLGHSIKQCAEIVEAAAIIDGDTQRRGEALDFIGFCDKHWKWKVSTHALSDLSQKRFNKPQVLPVTQDLCLLNEHLLNISNSSAYTLCQNPDPAAWASLAQSTLCQLILFNRRRGGEAERIKLDQFSKCVKTVPDGVILDSLSAFERKLCDAMWRLEIPGKRGRKVPVLFPVNLKEKIDVLVAHRQDCGIPETNVYLFARSTACTHIRSSDCLRKFAVDCGAQCPDLITTTRLRKHIATVSQILNLKGNEMDMLANFMGHDINIHRDYYRLPLDTLEVAKVSRILLAMEKGASEFSGKTLDEIHFNLEGSFCCLSVRAKIH